MGEPTASAAPRHQFRPPSEPNDEADDDQCDQEDERERDPALSACRRVRFCGCQHNVTLYRVCGPGGQTRKTHQRDPLRQRSGCTGLRRARPAQDRCRHRTRDPRRSAQEGSPGRARDRGRAWRECQHGAAHRSRAVIARLTGIGPTLPPGATHRASRAPHSQAVVRDM